MLDDFEQGSDNLREIKERLDVNGVEIRLDGLSEVFKFFQFPWVQIFSPLREEAIFIWVENFEFFLSHVSESVIESPPLYFQHVSVEIAPHSLQKVPHFVPQGWKVVP